VTGHPAKVETGAYPMKPFVLPLPAGRAGVRCLFPPPAWEAAILDSAILIVWSVTLIVWTVARFIIPMVVFWQFLRMCWYWNTPGVHAGWQFLAYFAAYSALYYFVGVYEPKLYRSQQNGKRNG
jgi:hypothetical protein